MRDQYRPTGTSIRHERYDNYEIYYLPYEPTLKQKLFLKFAGKRLYFLYKIAAFVYNIGENFSSWFTPYNPLYEQCRKLLANDKSIGWLLVTAYPFHLFKYGYRLNKEFGVKWIADYRDDWNTNELETQSFFKKIVQKVSIRNEVKWVQSARFFLSVSAHYVQKIQALLKTVPGHVILNGYMEENYQELPAKSSAKNFEITYVGSLYPSQPVETFLTAVKLFLTENPGARLKVNFLGLKGQPPAYERVLRAIKGFEENFVFTFRLTKREVIEAQAASDVLFLCAHQNVKGTPGSKLYEFIALRKPVLVCPSDREIVEETLLETGQGFMANNERECLSMLNYFYSEWKDTGKIKGFQFKEEKAVFYTRKEQAKKLSVLMKQHENCPKPNLLNLDHQQAVV
jgi:glycosyltransferase involved in cell wall biosynthesis